MQNPQIIRNYARALLTNLSLEKEEYRALDELIATAKLINANECYAKAFNSPIKNKKTKMSLIKLIIGEKKFSKIVESFLLLLTRNNRLNLLEAITKSLTQMLNEKKGIKNVAIISAKTLTIEDRQYLTNQLAQQLNLTIKAKFTEDESLIGGLKIKYDSKLIDLSIVSALDKINQQIKNISLRE